MPQSPSAAGEGDDGRAFTLTLQDDMQTTARIQWRQSALGSDATPHVGSHWYATGKGATDSCQNQWQASSIQRTSGL